MLLADAPLDALTELHESRPGHLKWLMAWVLGVGCWTQRAVHTASWRGRRGVIVSVGVAGSERTKVSKLSAATAWVSAKSRRYAMAKVSSYPALACAAPKLGVVVGMGGGVVIGVVGWGVSSRRS